MSERVGQQLGNYRLVRLLGRGGFADVYLGHHIHLNTQAAIKILHTQLESKNIEQFRTEARTLAHLIHPRIVRLLDFGIVDAIPYLIMDYASNGSLRQQYPSGMIRPFEKIVSIVLEVAEALQYAHDKKIIHRDVKPENIFLREDNEAVLGDFGIAVLSRTSESQQTQDVKGTVSYMAPEQLQGHPSRASDQYSLGIVVYECLTGIVPFHGSSAEIMSQHLLMPPPSIVQRVPLVSPLIEQVVLKALEKDPDRRFESVRKFAQALAAAVDKSKPTPQGVSDHQDGESGAPMKAAPLRAAPQRNKEQWLTLGQAHYLAGEYEQAVFTYNCAIQLDPTYVKAYYNRGHAYCQLKEHQRAIADYDRVVQLNPTYPIVYFNRGQAYASLGQYRQAIADYNSALQRVPWLIEAYISRGDAYCALEEYEQALTDYDWAAQLSPNTAEVYLHRGSTYLELKEYRKALTDLDRASILDPENVEVHNDQGVTYSYLREYEQAVASYDRAIALDPENEIIYYNRGTAYAHLKAYEQALADFDYAVELNPAFAEAYRDRALACYHLKDYQRAVWNFDYAYRLDPDSIQYCPERESARRKLRRKQWLKGLLGK
jgi:tetratricopeptide (TPR) repeat protein